MKRVLSLISILMIVSSMATGCFGGDEESPPEEAPTAEQAPATEPTPVPPTPEAPAATEEPAADTSGGQEPSASAGEGMSVEDSPAISSYRLHISLNLEEEAGSQQVEINGEFVKEPHAEHISMSMNDGTETQQIETLTVNDTNYVSFEDQWVEAPGSTVNLAELTLLTPQSIVGVLGQMEVVGPEDVGGRPSTHYRGGKDLIPVVGTEGDTMDVSEIADAHLDIWVDNEFNVINKLVFEGTQNATEPLHPFNLTYEYTDLNAPIEIVAPADAVSAEELAPGGDVTPEGGTEPEGDAEPASDFVAADALGELLGFNLAFPTGSTVDPISTSTLYVVNGPFTLEEAQTFVESQMQQNGYTQLSKATGDGGEISYVFESEQRSVFVTLSDAGDGTTSFAFVGA